MLTARTITDRADWDAKVNRLLGHPLQLWGWGEVKGAGEWDPVRIAVESPSGELVGCGQVLLRALPARLGQLAYMPRGPQCQPGHEQEVLSCIAKYLKAHGKIVALSIEPDWEVDSIAGRSFLEPGKPGAWRRSPNEVFIPTTLILDLTRPLDDLFADMKKKGRQYIRKGEAGGFEVRRVASSADYAQVLELYKKTAENAGFGLHEDHYYLTMPQLMGDDCRCWGAYRDGELHGFLWLAASEHTAFELYGGTSEVGQAEHVTPMLKWAVIQQCAQDGIVRYDLNGLLNDGISQFKRQFAKHENRLVGTWDLPMSLMYPAFSKALPLARRLAQRG